MLKELKDIINTEKLMDGVYFSEDEPIFGRGSEIVEQAKHAIIFAIIDNANFEDTCVDITLFTELIKDIEDGKHLDDYVKVRYNPMGAFIVSDAMAEE